MFASILIQILINGILSGTMYGIAAIGLSLIFGTMRIVFIAQGTMIILAAYGSFWLFKLWGIDPYVSILLVVPASIILGIGVYQGLFRKVARASQFPTLLIAFGLMALLENLMFVMFSGNARALQTSYASYAFTLFGMKISFVRLVSFVMAVAGTIGVTFFLRRTLLGKAVRAASESLEYVMLMGVTPHMVNTITFALGMGLAGLAGVATATTYGFDPFSGFVFSLKAMIALAIGGMASVTGALLGGILLGVVENYAAFFLTGGWADVISYAVFLLVLMFKPEGLFRELECEAMKNMKNFGLAIMVVAACAAVPLIFNPETSYVVYFLFMAFLYITLSQSWNLVAGYTGQVSLGQHAFFGLGGYVVAIAWSRGLIGYLDPIGFLLAGCAASALAIMIGIPLLSKLRGDYFALGTLGLGEILRLVTIQGGTITGGPMGILLPSSSFVTITPHYLIALFFALLAVAVTRYMTSSSIGLALVAIRDDEAAAEASGINILLFKVFAFAVGAFLAGMCGALLAFYVFTVEPQGFYNLNWTLYPVLMCVLGGAGNLSGPVIGAVFLTAVFEVAKYFLPEIHPIFSGLLIILAIMFLPNGLMGLRIRRHRKGAR